MVRDPDWRDVAAYGIVLDRDQNVWVGSTGTRNAHRYTPDRTQGMARVGLGRWTAIDRAGHNGGAGGGVFGIAANSRSLGTCFVWLANRMGFVVRVPASAIPLPKNADVVVDGAAWPAVRAGSGAVGGVAIDGDQNPWAVARSYEPSIVRIAVDGSGEPTAPDLVSAAQGGRLCSAGDRCFYLEVGHPARRHADES